MSDPAARAGDHGGVTDLTALADQLRADADGSSAERSGRTLVSVGPLRMTVAALAAGAELGEHENQHAASLQVLAGTCRLVAGGVVTELRTGMLVQLPDHRHAVTTETGCVLLLTVALLDQG